ncbi:DUF979 domain-containing protein [Olsenella sp. An290]|uniref:DUF979 domain-containing protein n=1 Tax=Olsenella sp. An290 TaxID=1965625 RepID=UPI000B37D79D|nr:DUF979 domain-containing protein [Olsenella sp. An290]OUO34571.1 hypothetical protein B5F84_06135 [Olsenella sp. An290]
MTEFLQFFQSADVTLSDKLLEVVYILIGLVAFYAGVRNALDRTNERRVGTALFWCILGVLFIVGRWIPSTAAGVLVVLMVIPPILKQVGKGAEGAPTQEEMQANYDAIGMKIFIPALSLGVMALVFALFTKISSLVGLTFGVVVGGLLLMAFSRRNTPRVFLDDTRRMLDTVGPLSMLPVLLAALGSIFTAAGVGEVISGLVSGVIPEGNATVGIIVYAVGMAVFTMVMGNAYGAITVLTVGIGAPFVLSLGADPALVGSVALTCGFCGTLMTPMAANFNIVPVAILEMKDSYGVIKKQVPIALFMLVAQIVYMIVFGLS